MPRRIRKKPPKTPDVDAEEVLPEHDVIRSEVPSEQPAPGLARAAKTLLDEAIKKVPAVRYALAVAGISGAAFLGSMLFGFDLRKACVAVVGTLVLMVVVIVISVIAKNGKKLEKQALFLANAYTLMGVVVPALLISSVFFRWPPGLPWATGGTAGGGGGEKSKDCYDVEEDFSVAQKNPSGAWQYGWAATLDGEFHLYDQFTAETHDHGKGSPSLIQWSAGSNATPMVSFNPSNHSILGAPSVEYPNGTYSVGPKKTNVHPGPRGEYSIVRWVAPNAGSIRIVATFTGESGHLGTAGTSTDVHVRHQGHELATGAIHVNNDENSFSATNEVTVSVGDAVDFAVGFGNSSNSYDSTEVSALICPTP